MSVRSQWSWKSARQATRRLRRRPFAATLGLGATILTGIGVMTMVPGSLTAAADAAPPPPVTAADVDSVLDARSPGARRYGWLLDSKANLRDTGPVGRSPTERVLSSVRHRPVPVVGPAVPQLATSPVVPLGDPVDGALAEGAPVAGLDNPGGAPGPSGFVGTPGGGGGVLPGPGGNSGGGGGDGSTPITPVSPVPEPHGWALMILGFALLGAVLRRRGPVASLSGAR